MGKNSRLLFGTFILGPRTGTFSDGFVLRLCGDSMISYSLAPHRRNLLWSAFLIHRLSGLCLALFLPLHFWVLSRALHDPAALEGFLKWTDLWYVKLGEYLLVFLLGAHFFGGLRLMAFEALPWSNRQKTFAALAFALSFISATLFLFSAVQYG